MASSVVGKKAIGITMMMIINIDRRRGQLKTTDGEW